MLSLNDGQNMLKEENENVNKWQKYGACRIGKNKKKLKPYSNRGPRQSIKKDIKKKYCNHLPK